MRNARVFMQRILFSFSLVAAAGILFTACKKDNGSNVPNTVSGLMAFNLAPDVSSLGISLSGNKLTNNSLDFTNFTGNYLQIYPGERTIESYDFATDSAIASSTFNFENDKFFSLFLIGNKGVYQNLVVKDDFDSLSSASGQAYIRYINAIPDSTAPTVTISGSDSTGNNTVSSFGSVSPFTAVSPGDITIGASNESTISVTRTFSVESGKAYTALLLGDPASSDSTTALQIKYIENGTLSN